MGLCDFNKNMKSASKTQNYVECLISTLHLLYLGPDVT